MVDSKDERIVFEDLPEEVREALELADVESMEGGDPIETFRKVSKEYPGFLPARLNLASYLLDRGQVAEARDTYQQVAHDYPDELGAKAGLATVFAAEGNRKKAEELAGEAIDGGYNWPTCYEVVAEAKEFRGDKEGAAQAYLAGYRLSPHTWNYLEHYCRLTGRAFIPPTKELKPCISPGQLAALADFIEEQANSGDEQGNYLGCNHTFRFTDKWAQANQVDIIELYQFVNSHGGFCDCEICYNVTSLLDD